MGEGGIIDTALLDELRTTAEPLGLVGVGVVAVDDPRFAAPHRALDGFLASGFAGEMAFMERHGELRKHPERMLEGAQTLVVVALPYRGDPGAVARYAQSADYHTQLHRRLKTLVAQLVESLPSCACLIGVDTKPILERSAAVLAGLGNIGKNGCVIVPGFGSYVLLGSILCTAGLAPELKPPEPKPSESLSLDMSFDVCGQCRACLDACPTHAFIAPGQLDPRRCISYLTIEHRGPIDDALAGSIGEHMVGCDVCQEVCPHNASPSRESRMPEGTWMDAAPNHQHDYQPSTYAVLGSSQYKKAVRGTAMMRIPRPAMRRNALIAIGNRRGPVSELEANALNRCCSEADPRLVAWARWAAGRRGYTCVGAGEERCSEPSASD